MTNHECRECGANFDGFLTSDIVRTCFISGNKLKNQPVPVSYTHLTLPTIYSV